MQGCKILLAFNFAGFFSELGNKNNKKHSTTI